MARSDPEDPRDPRDRERGLSAGRQGSGRRCHGLDVSHGTRCAVCGRATHYLITGPGLGSGVFVCSTACEVRARAEAPGSLFWVDAHESGVEVRKLWAMLRRHGFAEGELAAADPEARARVEAMADELIAEVSAFEARGAGQS